MRNEILEQQLLRGRTTRRRHRVHGPSLQRQRDVHRV